MDEYRNFKAALNRACEYGKISKRAKNGFRNCEKCEDPSALIYSACSDLFILFWESGKSSEEYGIVCAEVVKLVRALGVRLGGFDDDVDTVCEYAELSVRANTSDDPKSGLKALSDGAEAYNKSLQNLRYGLKLF